ncbi:hypothetical protein PQX77_012126 [Marasmius sp. AFHP31]|nr:hypothetical protein PQX77_012126 [Marasmius sp. AFHP31]
MATHELDTQVFLLRSPPARDRFDAPDDRVIHSFAILLTILRLARRVRIRLLSWDDYWAAFATVLVAAYLGVDWWKWTSNSARTAFTIDKGDGRALSYAINAQIAVSVMVCNLLVVITTLFRLLFWRKRTIEGDSEEPQEEYYNSGEHAINLSRTRGSTGNRTWGLTLTTIDSSTHNVGECESRFTEPEELQEQTYTLRSCGGGSSDRRMPEPVAEVAEGDKSGEERGLIR